MVEQSITEEDVVHILIGILEHSARHNQFDSLDRDRFSFAKDPSTQKDVQLNQNHNGRILLSGKQYGMVHKEEVTFEAQHIEGGSHNRGVKRISFQFGGNERTYSTIVKEGANAPLEQIEEGILQALQHQAKLYPGFIPSTPASLYRRKRIIALEDLLSRQLKEGRIVPIAEVFRYFHQNEDYASAHRLIMKVIDAYESRVYPTMKRTLEQMTLDHNGNKVAGLEYLRQEKLGEVQKAFPDVITEELERFYNYFELLLQHKKAPYFSADFRTLEGLFLPVKKLDMLAPKDEIAKDLNEGNLFVGWDRNKPKDFGVDDILFIDFEGFRVINSSHEQSFYWLLFYPEVINPNDKNSFVGGTADTIINNYARKRAGQESIDAKVVKERFYIAILKESLKHMAYFNDLGDFKKARYLHEVAISLTDGMEVRWRDAGIVVLNRFLKEEYKLKYCEQFDGKFSMRLHETYDPHGTEAVKKFGDVPALPVSILARSNSYIGPKRPQIEILHATIS